MYSLVYVLFEMLNAPVKRGHSNGVFNTTPKRFV
jgi:hypothetical protein